jgi:hypothetical protein
MIASVDAIFSYLYFPGLKYNTNKMAYRRAFLSADLNGYSHIFSPRKRRTHEYTGIFFQDGGIWNKNRYYRPKPDSPEMKWIGKYFIPDGAQPYDRNTDNYVMEHDIALFARPYVYQVIYVDDEGNFRSQPEAAWRPGRLNVMVNAKTNIIADIQYF